MLAMQKVSWAINFPGREFYEHIFYTALTTAAGEATSMSMRSMTRSWPGCGWIGASLASVTSSYPGAGRSLGRGLGARHPGGCHGPGQRSWP